MVVFYVWFTEEAHEIGLLILRVLYLYRWISLVFRRTRYPRDTSGWSSFAFVSKSQPFRCRLFGYLDIRLFFRPIRIHGFQTIWGHHWWRIRSWHHGRRNFWTGLKTLKSFPVRLSYGINWKKNWNDQLRYKKWFEPPNLLTSLRLISVLGCPLFGWGTELKPLILTIFFKTTNSISSSYFNLSFLRRDLTSQRLNQEEQIGESNMYVCRKAKAAKFSF